MTPVTRFSLACTRAAQAAQVIPPMTSSTWTVWVVSGAAVAAMPVTVPGAVTVCPGR